MFFSLYTDKSKGILTEQRFMKLTAALETEQEQNQCRGQELTLMMRQSDGQENDVKSFIKEIRQYATIKELDEAVLNRLVDRILIGEVRKEGSLFVNDYYTTILSKINLFSIFVAKVRYGF